MAILDDLASGSYLLVTTFRKDGTAVPTPVWVVGDGDALAIWTVTSSGKVKRIRRNPRVLVGPCDMRGRPTGDQVEGTASILDSAGSEQVRTLLKRKYGLMGRLTLFGSRLRRGADGTVGIRIAI